MPDCSRGITAAGEAVAVVSTESKSYDFCFGANSGATVRQDFETGSAALPPGWLAVDDTPVSEPGNWYVRDNSGPLLKNDGWAA